jgi:hypothetical protein
MNTDPQKRWNEEPPGDYTVVGGYLVPHTLIRTVIRWMMITIVFVAVVIGVLTGRYEVVLRWALAVETALFFVRRWLL